MGCVLVSGRMRAVTPAQGTLSTSAQRRLLLQGGNGSGKTTTERIKDQLIERGYPSHLTQNIPIPDDAVIENSFQNWGSALDSAVAFEFFKDLRANGRDSSESDKCRKCVWAKDFFNKVVVAGTAGLSTIQTKSSRDWMIDLAENAPQVPDDIAAILEPLLD